jgi:hypothetical protein
MERIAATLSGNCGMAGSSAWAGGPRPSRRRSDAALLGQDENRRLPVSEHETIEIITAEGPPSKIGSYQRQDKHGRVVRGDASGEWTLDENGEVDDSVFFFLSPSAMRRWTSGD